MLRGLKQSSDSETTEEITHETLIDRAASSAKKPLKVSSRNVLEGKVKRLVKGSIHTEVTIEVVHRVELTSTITTTSAEVLELEEGKTAYAVIKSSDVVIAME